MSHRPRRPARLVTNEQRRLALVFYGTRAAVQEHWATIQPAGDGYSLCLWGSRQDAEDGCDPDERVCRVRVEVLEIV